MLNLSWSLTALNAIIKSGPRQYYTFLVTGFLKCEQHLSLTLQGTFSDMIFSWKMWTCFGGLLWRPAAAWWFLMTAMWGNYCPCARVCHHERRKAPRTDSWLLEGDVAPSGLLDDNTDRGRKSKTEAIEWTQEKPNAQTQTYLSTDRHIYRQQ